jgi:hypothetical protein
MASDRQIVENQSAGDRVEGNVARFVALAGNDQMRDAAALVIEVFHCEFAQFLPAEGVIEQGSQNRAIAFSFECCLLRLREQPAGLMVAERGRFAFIRFRSRPPDTLDRIVRDSVAVAEILEERRQGR